MVIIVKPTHLCNLRCQYCFIGDKRQENNIISLVLAKSLVRKVKNYLKASKRKNIKFIWHGGEPLLWGVENFEQILKFCSNALKDYKVRHSLQTNLTLIDQNFVDLFKLYDVSVGFSLDGDCQLNDITRVGVDGKGTFKLIEKKIELCRKNNLKIAAIVVLTQANKNHIKRIYEYFVANNLNFKLNPVFNFGSAEGCYNEIGITVDDYANAMNELFDLWIDDPNTKIEISNLKEIASNIITRKPSLCTFKKNCQFHFISIAPNGDVYPCGRFHAEPKYVIGNISKASITQLLQTKKNTDLQNRHTFIENSECSACKYLDICHGGCVHDAITYNANPLSKTGLCSAYKKIFSHIEIALQKRMPTTITTQ